MQNSMFFLYNFVINDHNELKFCNLVINRKFNNMQKEFLKNFNFWNFNEFFKVANKERGGYF